MERMNEMFEVFRKEVEWAGRKLVLETGKIARQADGAVNAAWANTNTFTRRWSSSRRWPTISRTIPTFWR